MGGLYNMFNGSINFGDDADIDAFGRLRVSYPHTLFDSQNQYNENPLLWESVTTGSGAVAHLPNESSVRLRCTTASGDKVVRQTKQYLHYMPGKSQLILTTGIIGSKKSGVRQRIGYFDDENGVFFEQTSSDLKVVVRTKTSGSAVDTAITQSNWNKDKLDGTGPSGITLDMSKTHIFIIDLQWLGVGRVRFGFVINGLVHCCHEIYNANVKTAVYMTTANLPVRYEIENTGSTASTTDMIQICSSVISEGGYDQTGLLHTANNGTSGIGVTTRRSILSIRPKLTFNSIVNRALILPDHFDLMATTNNALYEIVLGGTLGGTPSWTSAGNNSVVEYDTAGTTVTGGEIISSGYLLAGGGNRAGQLKTEDFISKLPLTLNVAGDSATVFSIVATSFTGTSTINAAMGWKEIY